MGIVERLRGRHESAMNAYCADLRLHYEAAAEITKLSEMVALLEEERDTWKARYEFGIGERNKLERDLKSALLEVTKGKSGVIRRDQLEVVAHKCKVGLPRIQWVLFEGNNPGAWEPLYRLKSYIEADEKHEVLS